MEMTEWLQLLSELQGYPMTEIEEGEGTDTTSLSRLEERVSQIEGQPGFAVQTHLYRLQMYHCFRNTYQGSLEEQESGKRWHFESFLELVRILENQLGILPEKTLFPEAPTGTYMYRRDNQKFAITVLFHRNNTWQGTIRWVNGKKTINFKTCLELLLILSEICADSRDERMICTGD
ncbi:MAG: hypothetical protein HFG75_16470 [Hungatella sp.]|nr:hypothetical protein [Hungatella sp.]